MKKDTPKRKKLPKCQICGKNKLVGTKNRFYCKFCNFTHEALHIKS
ncbi:MAG: hypothetical protein KKB31_05000 [Nanoarchaeota archaeon]|nr:hypothetical protein [Nanoarchaeota archaeon]